MTNKMDEIILVTKRDTLFDAEKLAFQGTLDDKEHVGMVMKNLDNNLDIMRRGDAEENKDYKQPIPYAVIKQGDKYFGYTRLSGGGESRLHGTISLGVGGHMNEIEGLNSFSELLLENLMREVNEELLLTPKDEDDVVNVSASIIGLINDDSNDVGSVHLGILAFINLDEHVTVEVNEVEQLEGKWYTLEELVSKYDKLENWSKLVVDTLK